LKRPPTQLPVHQTYCPASPRARLSLNVPGRGGEGHFTLPYTWQRDAERADLPGVRMHDLRHSFASAAVAGGASLYLTAKLLGHKQSRTTERYAHFADDPVRAAADAIAGRLADALNAGTGSGKSDGGGADREAEDEDLTRGERGQR
jgi:integrase